MAGSWVIWEVCKAQGKLNETSDLLIKAKLDIDRLIGLGAADLDEGRKAMKEVDEKIQEIIDLENSLDPILRRISETILPD